jgi:hypothetical protein
VTRSCPRLSPEPISFEELMEVAKRHGLGLRADARCMEPDVVTQASTLVPYLPVDDGQDRSFFAHGEIICLLRKTAVRGAETIKTTAWGGATRFDLLNLSCSIHPSADARVEQIARVRAAFEDLASDH